MIIILNGTSSSGKSSLAHEIHITSQNPFLIFCMDEFFHMLHPRYDGLGPNHLQRRTGDPQRGFYTSDIQEGFRIEFGDLGQKLIKALPMAIKAASSTGLNFVVPTVIRTDWNLKDYKDQLKGLKVYLIYLDCDRDEIQNRERARKDRINGTSLDLYDRMTIKDIYDYKVDTTKTSRSILAKDILKYCYSNDSKVFS